MAGMETLFVVLGLILLALFAACYAIYVWPRRRLERLGWMKPFRSHKQQAEEERKLFSNLTPDESARELTRMFDEKN